MSSDFCSSDKYSSLVAAGSSLPETAGVKSMGAAPACLDSALPGLGMLVTVMPDEVLAASPIAGAAESGRGKLDAVTPALLMPTEADAGLVIEEAVVAARGIDVVAGDETAAPVGRNFLLERSTEPNDCQERL